MHKILKENLNQGIKEIEDLIESSNPKFAQQASQGQSTANNQADDVTEATVTDEKTK